MTDTVAIVGGGPVGAALALALNDSGLALTVLEKNAELPLNDARTLALAHGTRLILERLGVWSALAESATPITRIHVSQRGGFGRCEMRAKDMDLPALGYTVRYGDLLRVLSAALDASAATVLRGASVTDAAPGRVEYAYQDQTQVVNADLIALAEGGKSLPDSGAPVKQYGQSALVCTVQTELPHGGVAYERFTAQGPIALLPEPGALPRYFSVVWTTPDAELEHRLQQSDTDFMVALQQAFGDRQGRFVACGPRAAFPLRQALPGPGDTPGLIRIGNAAQTLHPVAGQGFNLGLRDAWQLAQVVLDATPGSLGEAVLLAAYRKARGMDVKAGARMTDGLVELFMPSLPGLPLARGLALTAMDMLPPLKHLFARKMTFGSRTW
jgi:2-octaprenyl-6-methoxyphenol hydroxylase